VLPHNGASDCNSAPTTINAYGLTVPIAELKLSQIAMQMLLATVRMDALHAALEN
jgi:hypothetical protein